MKTTGIVRKIDELGRIVVPKEMRRVLDIKNLDPVEIILEGNSIIITKYSPSCIYCGKDDNIVSFKSKNICYDCLQELKKTI